jgi:hypothetical protein
VHCLAGSSFPPRPVLKISRSGGRACRRSPRRHARSRRG